MLVGLCDFDYTLVATANVEVTLRTQLQKNTVQLPVQQRQSKLWLQNSNFKYRFHVGNISDI